MNFFVISTHDKSVQQKLNIILENVLDKSTKNVQSFSFFTNRLFEGYEVSNSIL